MSAVEKFPLLLSDAEEESSAVAPCFSHEGINVRCVCCVFGVVTSPPPVVPPYPRQLRLGYDRAFSGIAHLLKYWLPSTSISDTVTSISLR